MKQKKHLPVPKQKGSVWNMQQKFFQWAMVMAIAASVACTGCTQNTTTESSTAESAVTQTLTETDESSSSQTESSATSETLSNLQTDSAGATVDEDDTTATYDSFDAEITLQDDNTQVKGDTDAVTVDGNQVTITAGGTYSLSGSLSDGQLLITGTEKVKLYCDGVSITNSTGPALVCLNEKRTILSLAPGTETQLTDGTSYTTSEISGTEVSPSALFAQDKLTINGSGSLTINGNCGDGIHCKDDLKLVSGNITVTATEDGIQGKDCIALFGAEVTVTAGNDGLKSTETEDTTKGFLQLEDGTAAVTAGGDCFQAETLVWVTGGSYTLTSTGTATDAETGEACSAKGVHCTGDVQLDGGTLTIDAPEDGINCGGSLVMEDGTLQVTSGEDGIQADGDLTQNGGSMEITTTGTVASSWQSDDMFGGDMNPGGDQQPSMDGGNGGDGGNPPDMPSGDGFSGNNTAMSDGSDSSAETVVEASILTEQTTDTTTSDTSSTSGGSSKGVKCGGNLTMSGGSCTVQSTDHAIHATGTATFSGTTLDLTSDNKGISTHGNLTVSDGTITIQRCTEGIESKAEMEIAGGTIRILDASDDGFNTGGSDNNTHAMTISGGYTYICADGDGVDSNGTWTMTGGTLLVCGPISGGDGSLDAGSTMTYTGGTLLALSSKGMMEYPESGCLVATNCSASAGDLVSIVDADGNVLVSLTTPKAVSDVIYGIGDNDSSSYQIVTGGTYSGGDRNADGFAEGGTISGGTTVTANGGSGSNSGFGGGGGGGQPSGGGFGGGGAMPGQNQTIS